MRTARCAGTWMVRTPRPTTSSPPRSGFCDEYRRYADLVSATASALSGGSTAQAAAPHGAEAVEAGPSNEWLGIVLFIVSEAVMFGAFFAQYFYARIIAPVWPNPAGLPDEHFKVPAFPLPLILTVVLIASGV